MKRSEPLDASESQDDSTTKERPNPPRTTTGVWTSPKFGSAGSGGAELEPGPSATDDRDPPVSDRTVVADDPRPRRA